MADTRRCCWCLLFAAVAVGIGECVAALEMRSRAWFLELRRAQTLAEVRQALAVLASI